MADLAKQFFSKADIDAIEKAVGQAEAKTSGELLVRIVSRSYPWKRERYVVSAFIAVIAILVSLWLTRDQNWGVSYNYSYALLWGLGTFLVFFLVVTDRALKMGGRSQRMVHLQAEKELQRMPSTENATGVLIYVSLAERWATVVAQQTIYEKVPPEFWTQPLEKIVGGMKTADHAEGICSAIGMIGEELGKVLPKPPGNPNELPNRPSID